jgi:hypothetical protein
MDTVDGFDDTDAIPVSRGTARIEGKIKVQGVIQFETALVVPRKLGPSTYKMETVAMVSSAHISFTPSLVAWSSISRLV